MNRSGGSVLALAVLMAVFAGNGMRPSQGPLEPPSNHAPAGMAGEKAGTKQKPPAKTNHSGGDEPAFELNGFAEEANDLRSVIQSATTTSLSAQETRQLDKAMGSLQPSDDIGTMIALVPDPVKTHLSLLFDRYIDAIQQSLQDSKFDFDRGLLPWDDREHQESPNFILRQLESEDTEQKEEIPGVLIFRKPTEETQAQKRGGGCTNDSPGSQDICPTQQYPVTHNIHTLLIFVVGETPTAGIDRKQFTTALHLAQHFSNAKSTSRKPLYIIGPSFSGSLYSLVPLLQNEAGVFSPITIASGGVAGAESVEEFRQSVTRALPQNVRSPRVVNFASFYESSQVLETALVQHACDQWRLRPRDVAVVSETETAYGRQLPGALEACRNHDLSPSERTPLGLSFPRGIFHIRSAYQQQFPDGQSQGADRPQIRNNLRPNLEEQRSALDSVPNFSTQTPVSQEAVLMGVVDELQKHNSQLVLLMASDPLDTLFLVRYLRKNYAYGRLAVIGPDLLLRHEAGDPVMRGVMAVTSYSLRPGEGDDTLHAGDRTAGDLIFPDDSSIATYNASQALVSCLLRPTVAWCGRGVAARPQDAPLPWDIPLAEYGPSRFVANDASGKPSFCCRPEIHLDALGRGGFWPVASLTPPKDSWMPQQQANPSTEKCERKASAGRLNDSWKTLSVGLLGGMFLLTIVLYRASILSSFEAEVFLAPERCNVGGNVLSGSSESSNTPEITHSASGLERGSLIEILCLAASIALAFTLWPLLATDFTNDLSAHLILVAAVAIYVAIGYIVWRNFRIWTYHVAVLLVVICGLVFSRTPQFSSFLYQYVHVGSQVSPLVPLLTASLSLAWWAWYNISGRVLTDLRRPRLPEVAQGLPDLMTAISGEEQYKLERVMSPGYPDIRIVLPLCCIMLAVGLLIIPHRPLRSLQYYGYDCLLIGLLVVSLVLLLESALRILTIWTDAKCLLRGIESQSFRHMMSRIGGFSWTSIWKFGTGSLAAAHSLLTREFESLQVACSLLKDSSLGDAKTRDSIFPTVQVAKVWQSYVELLDNRRQTKSTIPDIAPPKGNTDRPANQLELTESDITECRLMSEFAILQQQLARSAALLLQLVTLHYADHPALKCELDAESLKKLRQDPPATVNEVSEYYVSLVYINYIITVLLRIRTLAAAAVGIFVFDVIALSSYPFEPRAILRTLLFGIFTALTICFGIVYAQMHRDPTLSRITDTTPGELGGDYWGRMLTVTGLPLLSLVATQFPTVGNFLFSWIEPAVKALR